MMNKELRIKVKLVTFSFTNRGLCVFLENNSLPSTEIKNYSNLELVVKNLFEKNFKTPIDLHYFEQLYTLSSQKNNDISIVYFALVENQSGESWREIKTINFKNGDLDIISYALQRLRWKVEYTNVVYSLLPKAFTLTELQKAYESILNKVLDKRNFRKKILSLDFLEPTIKKKTGPTRPALLFQFKKRDPQIIKVFS